MTAAAVSFFHNLPTCLFHFSVPSASSRIIWRQLKRRKNRPSEFSFYFWKVKVLVAQSCLTLCDPLDCSLPGSSDHGILQARILGWVAILFSRESSRPGDRTLFSYTGREVLYYWAPRDAPFYSDLRRNALESSLFYQTYFLKPDTRGLAREFIHFCVFF